MTDRNVWLDHNFKPGWLTELIRSEHELRPEPNPDAVAVREKFVGRGLNGAASAIDWITEEERAGKQLRSFGSGSIVPRRFRGEPLAPETLAALQELYIGDQRRQILPIAWLNYLARNFEQIPQETLDIIESVCRFAVYAGKNSKPLSLDELNQP